MPSRWTAVVLPSRPLPEGDIVPIGPGGIVAHHVLDPWRAEPLRRTGRDDVVHAEAAARVVERVVHRPERAQGGGRLAGGGGALGVRVELGQREVPEGEAQPSLQPLAHPAQDGLGGGAERALEVAVHHELQRGAGRAVDVVVGVERVRQGVGHGMRDPRRP